jgi:hypothetical protein
MFKDTAVMGENSWTPSSGVFPTNFETLVDVSHDSFGEPSPQNGHDDIEILSPTQPPNSTQLPNPTHPPQEKRKKGVAPFMQRKGKKWGTLSKLIHELGRISDVVELKKSTSSGNLGSSIRDVMERVCTLDGVEKGSDLHRMSVRIFQNRAKRDMFVVMEKLHLQLIFLKDEVALLGRHHFSIWLASG